MCGIVGYVGDRDVASVLLVGLERLSYRGYDSSGIAVLSEGELSYWKREGKIHELENALSGMSIRAELGIGQTRWATHGVPNERNAHPHLNEDETIALVHNGIIENCLELRKELQDNGVIFRSETDTEVIVHLVSKYYDGDLVAAVEKTLDRLEGAYAVAVVAESDPNRIIVSRKGSPLIIGVGTNENFVSSDINSIISHTKDVMYLEDDELAVITKNDIQVKKLAGDYFDKAYETLTWSPTMADKSGYDHYMLKEIHEQPLVVRRILTKYVTSDYMIEFPGLDEKNLDLNKVSRFIIQACGTSWHAGLVAKYLIEEYAGVLTEVDISSEFRYRHIISQDNSVVVAISQSGETADTLACIREAKSKHFKVLSFVNVKQSSIHRESDGVIFSHSGQEVGVASTKNFMAQLVCVYLFAIYLGHKRGMMTDDDMKAKVKDLYKVPDYIEEMLSKTKQVRAIADKYAFRRDFLFIGRGVNYPSALEGALKLKEISYIHATGYAAGELKHGPIALIDEKLPIVCLAPQTATYDKMLSNIQEVRSRKGKTIVVATEGDTEIAKDADEIIYIPKVSEELSPLIIAVPLQILAYYIALNLECDVDQPRNLAKSVTVE